MAILIADSGSTKCEWCLVNGNKKQVVITQGLSPYFLDSTQIEVILRNELLPALKKSVVDIVHFYGTGCLNPENAKIVKKAIKAVFKEAEVNVSHDLMGAARSLCGNNKGIACILGTGSNSCYFNGQKIVRNSPGLGYVLGDEGSGAYLGKKVIQYYLYQTFDEDLRYKFDEKYKTNSTEILENVYKKPLPNRYLASFTLFLSENRGHYMIENIIEDGLNDFFYNHLCKYGEIWKQPIHFVGGVSFAFKDVIHELCNGYEFTLGKIVKNPLEGLVEYHKN
ncbi:MAG: N-acetylglucosamine kinase [Chitinophagaceae bacterium]|nr:N-acetylglucosamine kinase [Chitinophagaceae bacterium]